MPNEKHFELDFEKLNTGGFIARNSMVQISERELDGAMMKEFTLQEIQNEPLNHGETESYNSSSVLHQKYFEQVRTNQTTDIEKPSHSNGAKHKFDCHKSEDDQSF